MLSIDNKVTILVDTREQSPWPFESYRCRVKRATLKTGDYSVAGHSGAGGIIIERKSLVDLFGSMTTGRDRFLAELDRMEGFAFKAVVVEATHADVKLGVRWSTVSGHRLLDSFIKFCVVRGIAPVFGRSVQGAEEMAWRMLSGFHAGRAEVGGGGGPLKV